LYTCIIKGLQYVRDLENQARSLKMTQFDKP